MYICSGYCKANRANQFIGRGTRPSDFSKGFSKGDFSTCSKTHMFETSEHFPLENPLDKSDGRVSLPIRLLARLAFQYAGFFYRTVPPPPPPPHLSSQPRSNPQDPEGWYPFFLRYFLEFPSNFLDFTRIFLEQLGISKNFLRISQRS